MLLFLRGYSLQVPKKSENSPRMLESIASHLYHLPWYHHEPCGLGQVIAPIWARKGEGMASRPEILILDESSHLSNIYLLSASGILQSGGGDGRTAIIFSVLSKMWSAGQIGHVGHVKGPQVWAPHTHVGR